MADLAISDALKNWLVTNKGFDPENNCVQLVMRDKTPMGALQETIYAVFSNQKCPGGNKVADTEAFALEAEEESYTAIPARAYFLFQNGLPVGDVTQVSDSGAGQFELSSLCAIEAQYNISGNCTLSMVRGRFSRLSTNRAAVVAWTQRHQFESYVQNQFRYFDGLIQRVHQNLAEGQQTILNDIQRMNAYLESQILANRSIVSLLVIQEMRAQFADLNARDQAAFDALNRNFQTRMQQLEDRLLTELKREIDAKTTAVLNRLNTLDTNLQRTLRTEIGAVRTSINNVNTTLRNINTRLTNLNTTLGRLVTQLNQLKTAITTLQTRVGTLTTEIRNLKTLINTLTREFRQHVAEWKRKHAELERQLRAVGSDVSALRPLIARLQTSTNQLLAAMKGEMAALRTELATLRTAVVSPALDTITRLVGSLQARLDAGDEAAIGVSARLLQIQLAAVLAEPATLGIGPQDKSHFTRLQALLTQHENLAERSVKRNLRFYSLAVEANDSAEADYVALKRIVSAHRATHFADATARGQAKTLIARLSRLPVARLANEIKTDVVKLGAAIRMAEAFLYDPTWQYLTQLVAVRQHFTAPLVLPLANGWAALANVGAQTSWVAGVQSRISQIGLELANGRKAQAIRKAQELKRLLESDGFKDYLKVWKAQVPAPRATKLEAAVAEVIRLTGLLR